MGVIHRRASDEKKWLWDDVGVYRYNSNDATKQVSTLTHTITA